MSARVERVAAKQPIQPGRYGTMNEGNVFDLASREAACDELNELLRDGAKTLIAPALEAEVTELLERFKEQRGEGGRAQVVRNGHQPEREIQTGLGSGDSGHAKDSQPQRRAGVVPFDAGTLTEEEREWLCGPS